MRGTMRTLRNAVRDQVEAAIRRVAAGVAQSCDVRSTWRFRRGNPVTQNSPAERELAAEAVAAAGLPLRRDMPPAMTGEDFAWYLQERPGAFVWIGNGPAEGGRELHNSNYDYNDAILPAAAELSGERGEARAWEAEFGPTHEDCNRPSVAPLHIAELRNGDKFGFQPRRRHGVRLFPARVDRQRRAGGDCFHLLVARNLPVQRHRRHHRQRSTRDVALYLPSKSSGLHI